MKYFAVLQNCFVVLYGKNFEHILVSLTFVYVWQLFTFRNRKYMCTAFL